MDFEYETFEDVINDLKIRSKTSRDPRTVRLSSVTSALVDVIQGDITASKVYASAVTTLEATLKTNNNNNNNENDGDTDMNQQQEEIVVDSLITQCALLELLRLTIPHVSSSTLSATITVTSRVLRATVASCQTATGIMETQDELGSINAVLRGTCRTTTEYLRCLPPNSTIEKHIKHLLYGTLLTLFQDQSRTKVRKAAQNGLCELLIYANNNNNNNNNMEKSSACHPIISKSIVSYIHSHLDTILRKSNKMEELIHNDHERTEFLNILSFLQRSIIYMDHVKLSSSGSGSGGASTSNTSSNTASMKIGSDIMEILMILLQSVDRTLMMASGNDGASNNYVASFSKKDSTSKITTINAIFATIWTMLSNNNNNNNDGSNNDDDGEGFSSSYGGTSSSSSQKHQSSSSSSSSSNNNIEFATRVLASLLQTRPSLVFRDGSANVELLQAGKILYGQVVLAASQRVVVVVDANDDDHEAMKRGCKLLPLSVQMIVQLSRPVVSDSTTHDGSSATVAETLMVELTQLFRTKLGAMYKRANSSSSTDMMSLYKTCTKDCLRAMEIILQQDTYYKETYGVSLKALAVLLQQIAVASAGEQDDGDALVAACVERLFKQRTNPTTVADDDKQTQAAVDDAISSLIQGVGLERFWKWVDWYPSDSTGKKRAKSTAGISQQRVWILQVMRSAAMRAASSDMRKPRIAFFQEEILSLARTCDSLSINHPAEAAFHRGRVLDLWNLLPTFCRHPDDAQRTFPGLSPILIRAMGDTRYHPQLVNIVCGALAVLANGVYERLAEFEELVESGEGEEVRAEANAIASETPKLLPSLFKLVDSLHATQPQSNKKEGEEMGIEEDSEMVDSQRNNSEGVQVVAGAISALARLAPKPFLQGMFKKVIQRLLEASQSDEDLSEKMCSLLSLAQALVVSECLDESSIALLYRALKPLIRTDRTTSRVQKRAYKVMAEICQRYHSFVTGDDRLQELCELLTSSIFTSQIAARHMRLKCLNNIVDGFDPSNKNHMETISKLVGEIILCLKDSNAKTREAAYQLLLSMANLYEENLSEFVQLVTGALGAETTHMRSAAVMALSRLVFEYSRNNTSMQGLLPSLLQTVLVLFDDTSREVIKSVVGFVRVSVAAMPPEQLHPLLPDVVGGLLMYHKGKDRFRAKIKIILKKLVKLYGFDALEPLVPKHDARLLTHMRKLAERDARRKARLHGERQHQEQTDDYDAIIGSDEEDSDDGRTLMTGLTGFSRMTSRTGRKSMAGSSKTTAKSRATRTITSSTAVTRKSKFDSTVRIRNDASGDVFEVADLTTKRVHFAGDDSDDDDDLMEDDPIEFDGMGKLIVRGDFDDNSNYQQGPSFDKADKVEVGSGKKRRISKLESAKEDRRKNQRGTPGLGAAYKSKKAGGDSKRKGQKYEPYAFLPLDGRNYSKKNRRKAVEQMEPVIRKGAKRQRR